jgi:hypothetical protein
MERDAHADADQQRDQESEARDPQRAAAESLNVDFEAGQEQEEREPDQRQDPNWLVDLDPAEAGGSDRDPGDDLEHHGGKTQSRDEPECEWRGERDHHDDQKVRELGLGHREVVPQPPASLQQPVERSGVTLRSAA